MDDILAPSGDNYKLSSLNVGDGIQFKILGAQVFNETDFKTKEVKLSKAGNPLKQLRLLIELEGEVRTLWLNKGSYFTFIDAIKAAGIRSFQGLEGRHGALKREEDTPSTTPGFAPRKNWKAVVA